MQSLKNKYKYLIFDFDGTINNTAPGIYATFKAVLDTYGVDYSNVDFDDHIGPPLDFSYTELVGAERCQEAIAKHVKVFAETNAAQNSFLYEGIVDTLTALKNAGYILAIASSKYQPHAIESLAYHNIGHFFDHVYGQTEKRGFKAEVLRQLIADNGWDKSKCLMIGDTFHDMQGALDNGIDGLAVTYGFGKLNDLLKANPIAVVHSTKEIADILL